jgi:hypothetical protein
MSVYGGIKNRDYVQAGFGALGMYGAASQFYNSFSTTVYHYTDEAGYNGILASKVLRPSQGFENARYGNGQYFSSISPSIVAGRRVSDLNEIQKEAGDISVSQLSTSDFRSGGNWQRLTHYVEIDVRGLKHVKTRPDNYLYRSNMDLNISVRIKSHGLTMGD